MVSPTQQAKSDVIIPEQVGTLAGLLRERIKRTPQITAYRFYDHHVNAWQEICWADFGCQVSRWQAAMRNESLQPGDRVAVLMKNCSQWAMFDQAALGMGLVLVPLYVNDRPDNIAYILEETNASLLLIESDEHWQLLRIVLDQLTVLRRIVTWHAVTDPSPLVVTADDWLPDQGGDLEAYTSGPDMLATIVYTSGTVGRPKGVMLSHKNILWNAWRCQCCIEVFPDDVFLSFLPLSHMLERTVGYYLPMMTGSTVVYARSVAQLAEDLVVIKPTVLISVPRIYERIYGKIMDQLDKKPAVALALFKLAARVGWQRFEHQQGRAGWQPLFLLWPLLRVLVADKVMARLGGRVRIAVCGGAPLPSAVARLFVGLGLPIIQGYGLTETSPVVAANRLDDNQPLSVGTALEDVEITIGDMDELLIKSPGVMLGYLNNPEATREIIDDRGWLHSGDRVRVENGHIYITGRIKEIIVMSNGEKMPPADMEMAIAMDPLFDQVMVVGEGRPFMIALIVLNPDHWKKLAERYGPGAHNNASLQDHRIHEDVCVRVARQLHDFPGYAQVRRVVLSLEPWTVENELITPTLKLRRNRILEHFDEAVTRLYEAH